MGHHRDLVVNMYNTTIQYVVKLVIKPRGFSPVARQPALPWQPLCTALVGGSPSC